MKGYGLALAAVIINVLYTLAVIWLAMHGLSVADLYNETLQNMLGGAGSGQETSRSLPDSACFLVF